MTQPLCVEKGGVVVSIGCRTSVNKESGTSEVTCDSSTKAGLSWSILTVSTHVMRSRVNICHCS